MATNRHTGHVIPLCRGAKCEEEADLVVAFDNRDAQPYCVFCGNAVLRNPDVDGLEYPLEEYYTPAGNRASQCDPYGTPTFTLFDPDDPDEAFLCADNADEENSSVHPHDNC